MDRQAFHAVRATVGRGRLFPATALANDKGKAKIEVDQAARVEALQNSLEHCHAVQPDRSVSFTYPDENLDENPELLAVVGGCTASCL